MKKRIRILIIWLVVQLVISPWLIYVGQESTALATRIVIATTGWGLWWYWMIAAPVKFFKLAKQDYKELRA